jgi:hypothetical protein
VEKFLITLLICILCIPLALGGVVLVAYINVGADSVPDVHVMAQGQVVQAGSYEWHAPVFTGILYKDFTKPSSGQGLDLGVLTSGKLPLEYPEGYETQATLQRNGEQVFTGTGEDWNNYIMYVNGSYVLDVVCQKPQTQKNMPYGQFGFKLAFQLNFEPVIETSPPHVNQGDVVAIRLSYLQDGMIPAAIVPEGLEITPFLPCGEGQMIAYIPTNWTTSDLEQYIIQVQAGDFRWELIMTVQWVKFPTQDLIIDETDPEITKANSQAAYDQYKAAIPPLWQTYDAEKYWSGSFMRPVAGARSTEYGMRRFTNGHTNSRFHAGQDIKGEVGTPILAPAPGRVIYADYLLNTGYTIVI